MKKLNRKREMISRNRSRHKMILQAAALAGGTFVPVMAFGQANYDTAGSTYSQTFDNLYTTVPANNTTVAATFLPSGWGFVEAGTNANTTLRNDNGSSGTGDTFLYGATNSNERAFGGYASGSLTTQFGLQLVNTSGKTLTSFTLSYTGEQWKDGGSSSAIFNTDSFAYGLGATSLTTGTYTNVTQLDFKALVNNTTADVTLDGNNAANQRAISFTVTGISWTAGQSLFLRWSDPNDAGNDDGLAIDNVNFSATAPAAVVANVVWATASGNWDSATGNWTGGNPTANLYKDGDNARFDNTSTGGTITISVGGVSPGSTTVDNDLSHPYTFTSTGSIGIATGSLTKAGVGTLTLQSQNTYAGGTFVNGGKLVVINDNQLGASAGAITFGDGELDTAAGITSTRIVTLTDATSSTFNTQGFSSTLGGISGTGTLIVTGAGALTASSISGASNLVVDNNTALTTNAAYTQSTGSLSVHTGAVLTIASASTSTIVGGTIDGTLVLNTGAPRINFNSGTVNGNGELQIQQTGTLISNTSGTVAGTVGIRINLNSTDPSGNSFTKGNVSAAVYTPGSFVTTIGGTKVAAPVVGNLVLNGIISGYSDVNIANNSTTGGGGGEITLNAANTYHGTTTINSNAADVVGTPAITLGVNNALPSTTDVIVGTQTGLGTPILDMNGHNQEIASLSDGANASSTKFLTITNRGSSNAVLTINGSTTPATAFGGVISDGATNNIGVTKSGSNTETFGGANTYSGNTTVLAGKLVITNGASIKNSNVVVDGATAVLEIDGTGDRDALGDSMNLIIADGGTINLNFTGTETLGSITINGQLFTSGTFNSGYDSSIFSGGGTIAVPEPGALSVLGLGAIGLLKRRRRSIQPV